MKTRKERFYKVPLCASECNQWFEDCKSDYTCAKNWIKDFKWNGTNQCVQNCSTFEETYGTAADFCQLVNVLSIIALKTFFMDYANS